MPMSLPGAAAMGPPARVAVAPSPRTWCVHGPHDPQRAEVEAFIAGVFAERFDAQVLQFAPMLVAVRDADGIVAAAGYRSAAEAPLFLERYLDAPVETLLASQVGTRPARERIVEVGHLAAARAGEGRRLIRYLGVHLASLGHEWVVSTLTEELRQLFVRLGVTPLALGHADPAMLGDDAVRWGRYYEHHPVVLAGQLRQALLQFARREARSANAA
jgi:hypothetical protein